MTFIKASSISSIPIRVFPLLEARRAASFKRFARSAPVKPAVVFATILLGEKMTIIQIVGAVCIIGGAMIGELIKTKK